MSNINLLFFRISSKFISTLIYWHCCDRCISRQNNTSARSVFINNTFSPKSKFLTPNMYYWSCKTRVTIYWTYLRMNGIWTKFFLRDAFSGSVAIFIVCKWRHSDVIAITLTVSQLNKICIKSIFRIFHILKINRIMPFCNLFIERPSYNVDFLFSFNT